MTVLKVLLGASLLVGVASQPSTISRPNGELTPAATPVN